MKIFKTNWTKWIPLGKHTFGYNGYVVFVKKNTKTGMLKFKNKSFNPKLMTECDLPISINTQEQWDKVTKIL